MSVEEFPNWDSGDALKYELVDGEPRAMAPVAPGSPADRERRERRRPGTATAAEVPRTRTQFSRMKVTSIVTRYSSILPSVTLALCSIT
jgi:hypothetical protein